MLLCGWVEIWDTDVSIVLPVNVSELEVNINTDDMLLQVF